MAATSLVILMAAVIKAWLIIGEHVPFNADEAVVGLMARHINQGQIPLFFYGQSYMGSLDALLIAGAFRVFGEQIWVIRLVQALLYLGTVWTTVELGREVFRSIHVGLLAGIFLAVPTVNLALYTTASLGGYGEALLLGNLILLLGFRIAGIVRESSKEETSGKLHLAWGLWGLMSGFGIWVFGLTLVYSIPMGLYLVWVLIQNRSSTSVVDKLGLMLMGLCVGAAPWLIYAFKHGLPTLMQELLGSAVADVGQIPVTLRPFVYFYRFVLLGTTVTMGIRPPWGVNWLLLPLIPFVLMFWAGVAGFIVRSLMPDHRFRDQAAVIAGVISTNLAGFLFTPFGADPSGRYFLPMSVGLALFAAYMVYILSQERKAILIGLTLLVVVYQLGGLLQSVHRSPHGLTTQFDKVARIDHAYDRMLIDFLEHEGETRGYTNYWVAYPLAFKSQESLIFVPRLPYHHDFRYTARDDRYPPYGDMVRRSDQVAYVTTNHPQLNAYLRRQYAQNGITWREKVLGDYTVFYDLSDRIAPEDIGLGRTTQP